MEASTIVASWLIATGFALPAVAHRTPTEVARSTCLGVFRRGGGGGTAPRRL